MNTSRCSQGRVAGWLWPVLLWLTLGMAAGAEPVTAAAGGRWQFLQLSNAPFPHPSRAAGFVYGGKSYPAEVHYGNNRVGVFVPAGFRPGTNVDVVCYFHGWRETLDRAIPKFQLGEQFAGSRRNALLVVPQGPFDAPDSSGGKLEDPDGLARFLGELMAVLRERKTVPETAQPGRVVLAAHSGGYLVISAILAHGGTPVQEVYLFDALYAQRERFLTWLRGEPDRRLVMIYNKDGGTLKPTQAFITELRERQIPALVRQEDGTTPGQLRTNRISILFSDLPHADVVHKHQAFREYLRTSRLEALPELAP